MLGIALSAPYFPERFSDVRAFYCAGQAVREHADPYREHPLQECERRVTAPGLSPLRNDVAVPVPFPGYVLALFALLSVLPFAWALALWLGTSCVALVLAVLLLARVTATPVTTGAIVLGFPALIVALPLGQITPFVLLALAASATLLQAGRPRAGAFAGLGTLLEPHVGVAVVLGIFAAEPRARRALAGGLLALVVLGCAVNGPAREWEFVRAVLPAHALANVADSMQFSLTNLAYVAGAPTALALALGSLWYVLALIGGTLIALRLRSRLGRSAAALIPPAFAVFGGVHTHLAQLALALPAFLLMYSRSGAERRAILAVVTFVAAIPWMVIGAFPFLAPATAVLAIAFARGVDDSRNALRWGVAALVTLMALFVLIIRAHVDRVAPNGHVDGNPLAEVAWQIAVLARNAPPEPWYLLAKAPTMVAFVTLLGILAWVALRHRMLVPKC